MSRTHRRTDSRLPVNGEGSVGETMLERLARARTLPKRWPNATMRRPSDGDVESMLWGAISNLATDGCPVEPDGMCPHDHPSWLLRLGHV